MRIIKIILIVIIAAIAIIKYINLLFWLISIDTNRTRQKDIARNVKYLTSNNLYILGKVLSKKHLDANGGIIEIDYDTIHINTRKKDSLQMGWYAIPEKKAYLFSYWFSEWKINDTIFLKIQNGNYTYLRNKDSISFYAPGEINMGYIKREHKKYKSTNIAF